MGDEERYEAAMHKVQTGVALLMERGNSKETEPKHLRVGVNSAMVDSAALAKLLMDKGIITEQEYVKAIADGAEREAASYERRVREVYGEKVTLG